MEIICGLVRGSDVMEIGDQRVSRFTRLRCRNFRIAGDMNTRLRATSLMQAGGSNEGVQTDLKNDHDLIEHP